MIFVADEGVDKAIVESIRKLGFEVIYIAEINPSVDDDYVLNLSNSKKAILITYDKDFGELIFRQRRITSGIILLRLEGVSTNNKIKIITDLVKNRNSELQKSFTVVSEKLIRLRKFKI